MSIPDLRALAAKARPPKIDRRAAIEARVFAGPDGRRYSTRSSKPGVRHAARRAARLYDRTYGGDQ